MSKAEGMSEFMSERLAEIDLIITALLVIQDKRSEWWIGWVGAKCDPAVIGMAERSDRRKADGKFISHERVETLC